MYQFKALAITKGQCITGFKAILHLCQIASGKRVSTWLIAGNGNVRADRRVSIRVCGLFDGAEYSRIYGT